MATVPSNPRTRTNGVTKSDGRGERELRRDRMIAVLIVGGMIALFGAIIWLASLNGVAPSGDYYDYDLWMGP